MQRMLGDLPAPARLGGAPASEQELREELENWLRSRPSGQASYVDALLASRGDELVGALLHAHQGDDPQAIEDLLERFADVPMAYNPLQQLPSRQALEAVLSLHEGISEAEGRERFAHLSWSELRELAAEHDLCELAGAAHIGYAFAQRNHDGQFVRYQLPEDLKEWMDSSAGQNKVGPGRRSGRLEDYDRRELMTLLGYQRDEAAGLSDEDLRGMALSEGLVPSMRGMPSHVELAWRVADARGALLLNRLRLSTFQRYLRMPYSDLAAKVGMGLEAGQPRDNLSMVEQLTERYPTLTGGLGRNCPLLANHPLCRRLQAGELNDRLGLQTHWQEEERYQLDPQARREYVSPIEHLYGDELRGFVQEMGGGRFRGISGHGGAGRGWAQATHNKSGRRNVSAGTLAFYRPDTGQIHVHPDVETKLRKARRGKASAEEVSEACGVIAHELLHTCSGDLEERLQQKRALGATGLPSHTIEEGTVSNLQCRYADNIAQRLGLWDEARGALPAVAYYPYQREAVASLASLAAGSFDAEQVREGAMEDPKRIPEAAYRMMEEAHRTSGASATRFYAQRIAERYGVSNAQAEEAVREILTTVPYQLRGGFQRWSERTAERMRQQMARTGERLLASQDPSSPANAT